MNDQILLDKLLKTQRQIGDLQNRVSRLEKQQTPAVPKRMGIDTDYCKCDSTSKKYTEWKDKEPKSCGCSFGQCSKGLIY